MNRSTTQKSGIKMFCLLVLFVYGVKTKRNLICQSRTNCPERIAEKMADAKSIDREEKVEGV